MSTSLLLAKLTIFNSFILVLSALMFLDHALELRGRKVVDAVCGLDELDHLGREIASCGGLGRCDAPFLGGAFGFLWRARR